jgi:hypothetical protein
MVCLQDVEVSLFFNDQADYFPDTAKRLVHRLSLAITTFEERTFYCVESALVLFEGNGTCVSRRFVLTGTIPLSVGREDSN